MHGSTSNDGNGWLAGPGEAAALARATDWGATPLGPVEGWPRSLRTTARICLATPFPMVVMWGPELVMLYNDGYRPILGERRHPQAMGQRVRECWAEIWPDIGPLLAGVLATGETVWREDQHFLMTRNGYPEECYFTFAYSPIHLEDGRVGGVLATVTETTERVLGERRLRMLHELARCTAGATDVAATCARIATALASEPAELPFALLYRVDDDGAARLSASAGLPDGSPLAVGHVPIGGDAAGWPLAAALADGAPVVVRDLAARFGAGPTGGIGAPAATAVVLPALGADSPSGRAVLVAGVNPHRALDDEYHRFLALAAHHVGAALAEAHAHAEERRRAALVASEARFRSFAASTPALIWTADPDGRCDYFNEAWLGFTGRTLEQELGDGWAEGVHPEDLPECLRVFRAALAEGVPFRMEYRLRHADGGYRWVMDVGAPRFDADGTFIGHIGTCLDITERRSTEVALRSEKQWLRALNACSPLGIFTSDDAGRVTYANPVLHDMLGRTAAEMLGDDWSAVLHPDDRERHLGDWRVAAATGRPFRSTTRVLHRTRGLRWLHVHTAPLQLETGAGMGHVGTVEDVTERHVMEEALRRAELKYRELVEMSQAVVWRAVGELPAVTFVNGRAAELSGIPVDRWTAEPLLWLERTLEEDRPRVLEALARARHAPQEIEVRMRDAAGEVVCLRNYLRYVGETPEGPEFIGVMVDETELRRAREEAEASRARLRDLADRLQAIREQEQARIAREIHDELGQMLTGAKMQLAWLVRRLPGEAAALVPHAAETVGLLDATIDTVRRIATRLRPGVLDDLGLVPALEWLVRDFEKRTGVPCRLTLPPGSCRDVEEHATTLFRIAQEALTNVSRHAGARHVAVTLHAEHGQHVLTVADDGRGIPADATATRPSLGILGMRERALASGGTVTIRSAPGAGTTVVARVGRRRDDTLAVAS